MAALFYEFGLVRLAVPALYGPLVLICPHAPSFRSGRLVAGALAGLTRAAGRRCPRRAVLAGRRPLAGSQVQFNSLLVVLTTVLTISS